MRKLFEFFDYLIKAICTSVIGVIINFIGSLLLNVIFKIDLREGFVYFIIITILLMLIVCIILLFYKLYTKKLKSKQILELEEKLKDIKIRKSEKKQLENELKFKKNKKNSKISKIKEVEKTILFVLISLLIAIMIGGCLNYVMLNINQEKIQPLSIFILFIPEIILIFPIMRFFVIKYRQKKLRSNNFSYNKLRMDNYKHRIKPIINKKYKIPVYTGIILGFFVSLYFPHLFPHIGNIMPPRYRYAEKMFNYTGWLFTIGSEGSNGKFIYKYDDEHGFVCYEGEYKYYKPNGAGIIKFSKGNNIKYFQAYSVTSHDEFINIKKYYDNCEVNFKDNKITGSATMKFVKNSVFDFYTGTFYSDFIMKDGELVFIKSNKYGFNNYIGTFYENGIMKDGILTYFENNNHYKKYDGTFYDNGMMKDGKLDFEKDNLLRFDKFVGTFYENGEMYDGTLTYLENDDKYKKYVGTFTQNGERIDGTLSYENHIIYDNYRGTFTENGKMNSGVLTYKKNNEYHYDNFDGDFKDNEKSSGTLTFSSTHSRYKSYTGKFNDNGKFDDKNGTIEMKDGTKYSGKFENGVKTGGFINLEFIPPEDNDSIKLNKYIKFEVEFYNEDNDKISKCYIEFADNNTNGFKSYSGTCYDYNKDSISFDHGKLTYTNEDIYEGSFKDNKPHSKTNEKGEMVYSNSETLEKYYGEWDNGNYQGKGTLTYKAENKNGLKEHVGNWENGERQGQGKLTFKDGNNNSLKEYDGNWENNKPNGQGILIWTNGNKYVGKFENGLFHGDNENNRWEFKDKDIGYIEGTFQNGVFQKGNWQFRSVNDKDDKYTEGYWNRKNGTRSEFIENGEYKKTINIPNNDYNFFSSEKTGINIVESITQINFINSAKNFLEFTKINWWVE